MTKRKRRKKRQRASRGARPIPSRLIESLDKAERLLEKKHWAEARDLLLDLDRRYPHHLEVLTHLVNAYYELGDTRGYQYACERLVKVDPNNADAALGLAGTYLEHLHPILALRDFRRFLERWPEHERADDVRGTVANLEETAPALFKELGVSLKDEQGWQLAFQHEEMQVHLEQGRFDQVRQTAKAILQRDPEFAPALNNLSIAHWVDGQIGQAIAASEKVLAFEPENVHALSNLVHFLYANGRSDKAQTYAEQLKASTAPAWKVGTKRAEALTFVGDYEGVLEVLRQTEQSETDISTALLYHLAAVATMRLGEPGDKESEKHARRYWKQALKLEPGFRPAQKNLADLDRPLGERHAPWPFPLRNWISPKTLDDLLRFVEQAERKDDDKVMGRASRRFLRKYPAVAAMIPTLLERGDEDGREFAVLLARTANSPELLRALKDFVLSQYGPDELRMEAAQPVKEAGLFPSGMTRVWLEGQWREIMIMGIEIHGEPLVEYSPQVEDWMNKARSALFASDGKRAERALKRSLAVHPNDPSLLNNLAIAYSMQGRKEEADTLVQQIHEQHPDYLFARVGLAQRCIERGEFEQARQLLDPLMHREQMHYSEFDSFCGASIQLYLAEGNTDAARSWFEMWEQIDPENPKLELFRRRVSGASLFAGLKNLLPGR